ncbi:MAG: hypothetical protein K2X77_11770 [Candidatus Obscuribacterales bacterium]|jgi:hypothetical protein|nr:hypothetical protein [Candidatus Obscuribacterales bacterium]
MASEESNDKKGKVRRKALPKVKKLKNTTSFTVQGGQGDAPSAGVNCANGGTEPLTFTCHTVKCAF